MRAKENKQYTWLQGEGLAGRKPSNTRVATQSAPWHSSAAPGLGQVP